MEKGVSKDHGCVNLDKDKESSVAAGVSQVDESQEKPVGLLPKKLELIPCSEDEAVSSPKTVSNPVDGGTAEQATQKQGSSPVAEGAQHVNQQASGYPQANGAWPNAGCSQAGGYPPPPYGYPPPHGYQAGYGYPGYGYGQNAYAAANAYAAPNAAGVPPQAQGGAGRTTASRPCSPPPSKTVKLNLTGCFASGFLFSLGACIVGFIALIGLFILLAVVSSEFDTDLGVSDGIVKTEIVSGSMDSCIAVISVKGIISGTSMPNGASSEAICKLLRNASEDNNVKAIVLDMDTPGGEVTASDEIHQAVMDCRSMNIPVVTCMRSMGASGGYYIACASDWIISNRMTFTGSIGVIMSSFNMTGLGDKIGVKPQVFKSGSMKDAMSPMREMTEPEKAYVQGIVDNTFTEFAKIVALGRKQYKDVAAVKAAPFADGRVVSGTDAFELGLVDELGGMETAYARAAKLAGIENPRIIRYSMPQRLFQSLLDMKAQDGVTVNVSGVPKLTLEAGKMYFIMPECIAK